MKNTKIFINGIIFLLAATKVSAQESATPVTTTPFYTDTTFWLFTGGAIFLILVLIVKKIIERKNKNYEDTNI